MAGLASKLHLEKIINTLTEREKMKRQAERVLILGGAGLVGAQVARHIARVLKPRIIVIASLYEKEVREALEEFRSEFPKVTFDGYWGDIFVRKAFSNLSRAEIIGDLEKIRAMFLDVFGDKSNAYHESKLVDLIHRHKPDIVIDAINTATAISYQDVYTSSLEIQHTLKDLYDNGTDQGDIQFSRALALKMEQLFVSHAIPQLIRHVQLLWDAMCEVGTQMYLKIGTTGTGGMGLNIPYTHSEDKPSAKLMSKTAVAFAHTGLMFLMARTPNGPIVKEIKPGAMIGYRKVDYRTIRKEGETVKIYPYSTEQLSDSLDIRLRTDLQPKEELKMVGVDTGENGFFTLGEFQAITSMYQMEFVTPEEISQNVILEIMGSSTGKDVISAIDGAVMDPSYRAGYLRGPIIQEMAKIEWETKSHSVALGQLGPPELSKLLYEAHLLKLKYGRMSTVMQIPAEEISKSLHQYILENNNITEIITSIGIPILLPDGRTILRGRKINIPEYRGIHVLKSSKDDIEAWAQKGWVDLRVKNFAVWQQRFKMMKMAGEGFIRLGSAAITMATYIGDEIQIGEVVAWIFNNDPEIKGYRIKAL